MAAHFLFLNNNVFYCDDEDLKMEKKRLDGLTENDYIHADELSMRLGNTYDAIQQGLDKVGDVSVALMRRMTLGRYVEVDEITAPELTKIVKDVCRILDCSTIPAIYLCHQAVQTYFCAGSEKKIIVISDYMVENLDEDMLYFIIGNIISMFKCGHVGIITAYAILPERPITAPLMLAINQYLRAADLTSDRGGLLACQSISTALKYILWEAGTPMNDIRFLDEEETIALAKAYVTAKEEVALDAVTGIATQVKEYMMDSMPHAHRIKELLAWYENGYHDVISSKGGAD